MSLLCGCTLPRGTSKYASIIARCEARVNQSRMGTMKRFFYFIALVACLLFAPSAVLAEEITSFSADITINQSGTMDIVETIRYDFGEEQRHGIFRTIPLIKAN